MGEKAGWKLRQTDVIYDRQPPGSIADPPTTLEGSAAASTSRCTNLLNGRSTDARSTQYAGDPNGEAVRLFALLGKINVTGGLTGLARGLLDG
jgi:hypothetical protein